MSEDPGSSNLSAYRLTEAEEARRAELCQAAIGYARRGWAVIPVRHVEDGDCSCQKGEECASPGKHPVYTEWPERATADPLEAAHWWRPPPEGLARDWWPLANIGIVTGRKSGIFVLDVDSGGDETLARYEARHGSLPVTRVASTGSGGVHYYFTAPGFPVRNSARKVLGEGLDIRGENGFVVAPPSVSGRGAYTQQEVQDIAPVPAPDWLLDLLRGHDQEQTGASIAGGVPEVAGSAGRRYAEAALRAEVESVRSAGEGTRNDTLNTAAFSLGTLGAIGLLEYSVAYAALRAAAQEAGLGEAETRATFMSGWKSGLEKPRAIDWREAGHEWPVRSRTDFGLADRMVDHFGDMLSWCPERSTWMTYQRGVWVTDQPETGEWYAQAMIRSLMETEGQSVDEEPEIADDGTVGPSPRDMFREWAAKQQTRKAVSAAERLARGLPLMRMNQDTFDLDPMMLNVRNGVVDLATGECREHDPGLRMTLQAAANYRRGETAPQWEAFLRRVQPNPEMRAYLQRVAGYCATGLTSEQAMFLWHGSGANGKSVAQAVIAHVLGTYAQTMPVSTLMASTVDDRIPNDVARMAGRRFLVASETKQGKALDEQRMKQLTGGDTVSARYMRAEWFEFKPVGKIQLTTNHLPKMSDDKATWRRLHLIPWPVSIPLEEQDGFLQERLIKEESSGILNWIIDGALAWLQEGLNPPEGVQEAKEQYRVEEDVVEQFIAAMIDMVPAAQNPSERAGRDVASIHMAFKYWATNIEDLGKEGMLTQKALTARLKKRGFEYLRVGGWAGFLDLQVRPSPMG